MKQCLICLAILEEQLNFMDLLLLKRKEEVEAGNVQIHDIIEVE